MADFTAAHRDGAIDGLDQWHAYGGTVVARLLDGSPTPDVTPPTIENVTPASGSRLHRLSPVQFDVLDASAFAAVLLLVRYPSGAYEVVHDGTSFADAYAGSTRSSISGGYRFTVSRAAGWREAPTFRVIAVDAEGNSA